MTALPTNLAFVGEDLARAIKRDAQRSLRRRRTATLVFVIAVLVVTATASVANGWLFGETPTLRAVPSLGDVRAPGVFAAPAAISAAAAVAASQARHRAANPGDASTPSLGVADVHEARTLLSDLGPDHRSITAVATTSGAVCLALTGFPAQCVPAFTQDQQVSWFIVRPTGNGPAALYGLVRDGVTGVEAVFADGSAAQARLENNAFYVELTASEPGTLVVQLDDGSSQTVASLPCPLDDPNCTK
jgi:hypothetical protein